RIRPRTPSPRFQRSGISTAFQFRSFRLNSMADDGAPKSAFELAMERLRKKDAEEGVTTRTLTDEEKAAIAEVRSLYDSKIAEQEILHQAAMRQLWDADRAETAEGDRRCRREKDRLASERDAKVEKIRRGDQ